MWLLVTRSCTLEGGLAFTWQEFWGFGLPAEAEVCSLLLGSCASAGFCPLLPSNPRMCPMLVRALFLVCHRRPRLDRRSPRFH